jgi:hypothetical protein
VCKAAALMLEATSEANLLCQFACDCETYAHSVRVRVRSCGLVRVRGMGGIEGKAVGTLASSSSCDPSSATWPWLMTTMVSALLYSANAGWELGPFEARVIL